MFYFTSRVSKM